MNHPSPLEAVFFAALEKGSPGQRAAYLDEACAHDSDLRRRVEKMLAAQVQAGSFLEQPAAAPAATIDEPITERPGTVIGPYKLMEQIGEGGMGLVFVAEQQHPVRRKVALKVIKPGMDTRQVIARFEAERQALALMDHPNIAKVLDGGETASGRPFFVMELVKGVPITDYCDQNQVPVRERLELFLSVCQAVQHAHQKGIIHRDIKPSNVLVMSNDGQPVVRVIDFGVAKAVGQQLTDKTIYTQLTQLIGTPLYMAPEQAGESSLDVDTRSDIYSLGVLLYELLTGTTPFDKERLRTAAYDEMRRIIREEEPPKPSTRLSTLGQAAATLSTQRKSDPRRLSQLFRGELDWIVMKCLEKDRNRRYETASAFAGDVQRYLQDEPVQACPPSVWYRFRKFARRNKRTVGTASLVLAALTAGIVGTSAGLIQAKNAAARALGERDAKAKALKEAEQQTAIASAVTTFLQKDLLEMADVRAQFSSNFSPDPDVKLRTLLDRAERRVAGRFRDQPDVEAAIRETLASAFVGVGEYGRAAEQYAKVQAYQEATLGGDHPDTLLTRLSFAETLANSGRRAEAVPHAEEVFRLLKAKLGDDDRQTLIAMASLACAYTNVGRSTEALALYREAHRRMSSTLGPDEPETLNCLGNVALLSLNDRAESLALLEEVVRLKKAKLGAKHPDTLGSGFWLVNAYLRHGRVAEAVSLSEETLKLRKEALGTDHPGTARNMSQLGDALVAAGRVQEALPLHEEALRLHRAKLGPGHYMTLDSLHALARAYLAVKQPEKAVPLYEESLAISEKMQSNGWRTRAAKLMLSTALVAQKKYPEAETLLLQVYEGLQQPDVIPQERSVRPTQALKQLVQLYDAWGKPDKSAQWRKKLQEEEKTLPLSTPSKK